MTLQDLLQQILTSGLEITIVVKRHADAPPRPTRHSAECEFCGWTGTYDSPQQAARALRSHQNHCTVRNRQSIEGPDDETRSWLQSISSTSGEPDEISDDD